MPSAKSRKGAWEGPRAYRGGARVEAPLGLGHRSRRSHGHHMSPQTVRVACGLGVRQPPVAHKPALQRDFCVQPVLGPTLSRSQIADRKTFQILTAFYVWRALSGPQSGPKASRKMTPSQPALWARQLAGPEWRPQAPMDPRERSALSAAKGSATLFSV